MKERAEARSTMRVGDRVLVNKGISKEVLIVARAEIAHSTERAFVTKSGGDFTIGRRIWKPDYTWNEKSQMWVPKG